MRVVAYARVSSDSEDQLNSYNNQLDYWKEYIESKEGWEFVGIYADEGLSGTSTKKRDDFNRMISDASEKKFDLICTKSVSRFARNTVDCLQFTRYLKTLNIGVFFESDNINSLDGDGELRLTIMATLAQEESRRISENVKWGHKQAMKKGIVYGNNRVLGYDIVDKKLVLNPKEAEIVKKIFDWFLQGESLHNIVRLLADIGITTGKIGGKLSHSSIKRMLSNEKYCGILKQGKYTVIDFLTHQRTKNKDGHTDIKYDNHEPIIDFETWQKVQMKLNNNREKFEELGIGYTKHVWGNKIICGCCGTKYRRKTYKNKDGSPRPAYICNKYNTNGTKVCNNGSYIREDILEIIFTDVFKQFISDKPKHIMVKKFIEILNKNISEDNSSNDIENLNKQLTQTKSKKSKLLDIYLDDNLSKEDYNTKNDELTKQENEILESLNAIQNKSIILSDKKKKLEMLYDILHKEIQYDEFQPNLVNQFLEQIIINKDKLKIFLTVGEFEADLSKYPKRINSRECYPIMDTIYRHKIDCIIDRYIDFNIEVYIAV